MTVTTTSLNASVVPKGAGPELGSEERVPGHATVDRVDRTGDEQHADAGPPDRPEPAANGPEQGGTLGRRQALGHDTTTSARNSIPPIQMMALRMCR